MVALQMLLLSAGCALMVWMYEPWWARVPLGWGALTFLLVGIAYALRAPGLFGKRLDGRLRVLPSLVLLPFILLQWGTHHAQRKLSREDAFNEIVPGLWLGRRLTAGERDEIDVPAILDLTSEWTEPAPYRQRRYLCIPLLDKTAPTPEQLDAGVMFIQENIERGVYVHCAQGHGRSGTFVAAALIALGKCAAPDEALKLVQQERPGARPSRAQRASIERFAATPRSAPS